MVDGRRCVRAQHRALSVRGARAAGVDLERAVRSATGRCRAGRHRPRCSAPRLPSPPWRGGPHENSPSTCCRRSTAANGWSVAASSNGAWCCASCLSAIWACALVQGARISRTLSQQLEAVSREGRPAQTMLREITDMRQQIDKLQQHRDRRPGTGTTAAGAGGAGPRQPGGTADGRQAARDRLSGRRLAVVDTRKLDTRAHESTSPAP